MPLGSMRLFKDYRRGALILVAVAGGAFASPDKFTNLLKSGNYQQIVTAADSELKTGSTDTGVRFYRAVALAQLGQLDAAIKEFSALAKEMPNAPEPQNNLAVLYAQQGDYDKAQAALDAALATNPSYRTAHKNLGDLYATMAAQAYNRALARTEQKPVTPPRLALLDSLEKPEARRLQPAPPPTVATASADAPPAPSYPSPKPAAPGAVAAAPVKVAAKAPEKTAEKLVLKSQPEVPGVREKTALPPKAAAAATPAPAPKPVPPSPATTKPPEEPASWQAQALAINEAVRAWAEAWTAQDVPGYLAAYASNYVPEGGVSRADWEKTRSQRITAPKSIKVQVVDLQVKLHDDNTAAARFMQSYQSDLLEDTIEKRLDLVRENGRWKIIREIVAKRSY